MMFAKTKAVVQHLEKNTPIDSPYSAHWAIGIQRSARRTAQLSVTFNIG